MSSNKTIVFRSTSRSIGWIWVITLLMIGVAFYMMQPRYMTLIVIAIIILPIIAVPFVYETLHEIRNDIIYTRIPKYTYQSNGDPTPYMSTVIKDIKKVEILYSWSKQQAGIRVWINEYKVDSRKYYVKDVSKLIYHLKEINPDISIIEAI